MSAAAGHDPAAWLAITRKRWWRARRRPYNRALLVASGVAFNAHVFLLWLCESRLPDVEVTILSLAFPCFACLLGIGVANLCFSLAPLGERVVAPRDAERFRTRAYALGLWFFAAVPFAFPAVTLAVCVVRSPAAR